MASGGVRRYFWSNFSTVLVTEMSGEVQMNGLLGHELITDVTDGELVAVNKRV